MLPDNGMLFIICHLLDNFRFGFTESIQDYANIPFEKFEISQIRLLCNIEGVISVEKLAKSVLIPFS